MPRATVDINDTRQFDLKTLAGGQVTLRRMSYGKYLERQQLAMTMAIEQAEKKGQMGDVKVDMNTAAVAYFEFKECIVDHNLTDHDDQPLDFRKPHTITLLDPRIGQEIGDHIREMNELEATLGNSDS